MNGNVIDISPVSVIDRQAASPDPVTGLHVFCDRFDAHAGRIGSDHWSWRYYHPTLGLICEASSEYPTRDEALSTAVAVFGYIRLGEGVAVDENMVPTGGDPHGEPLPDLLIVVV